MTAHITAALMAPALAVAVVAVGPPIAAGSPARHTKPCGEKVWSGAGKGPATIIQDLRVRGVSCARGLRVAGHGLEGHPPAGWRCHLSATPIRCAAGRR